MPPGTSTINSGTGVGNADAIFQIHATTKVVSEVAAAVTGGLFPGFVGNSLAADPSGNIYFAENNTIHRLALAAPAPPPSISANGVGVMVNGVPAYVYYISPTQINALAPEGTPSGQVTVQVTNSAGSSNSITVTAQAETPEFFRFSQGTGDYAAALLPNGTYIAAAGLLGSGVSSRPAKTGDVVELFAAGLGPTNPAFPDGMILTQAYPTQNPVTVTIGGQPATVQLAGMTVAGQYQVNVVVPQLPNGDAAITITVNGASSQHNALISIQN